MRDDEAVLAALGIHSDDDDDDHDDEDNYDRSNAPSSNNNNNNDNNNAIDTLAHLDALCSMLPQHPRAVVRDALNRCHGDANAATEYLLTLPETHDTVTECIEEDSQVDSSQVASSTPYVHCIPSIPPHSLPEAPTHVPLASRMNTDRLARMFPQRTGRPSFARASTLFTQRDCS